MNLICRFERKYEIIIILIHHYKIRDIFQEHTSVLCLWSHYVK
jgi:hypothetical protein